MKEEPPPISQKHIYAVLSTYYDYNSTGNPFILETNQGRCKRNFPRYRRTNRKYHSDLKWCIYVSRSLFLYLFVQPNSSIIFLTFRTRVSDWLLPSFLRPISHTVKFTTDFYVIKKLWVELSWLFDLYFVVFEMFYMLSIDTYTYTQWQVYISNCIWEMRILKLTWSVIYQWRRQPFFSGEPLWFRYVETLTKKLKCIEAFTKMYTSF